ncbi:uncharacterized protein LOC143588756 [Bidens hawaiensis]|uniref:uncharacterized protein LOC143588756 n=1 Tax=Bidens hawaiensis TaxID=980011 RepID=UPI0040496826
MSKFRGQGYDGASNMRGELNGLKQKNLAENKCAFYIHCFAHQLQLVVVATSSEYASVSSFFDYLTRIVNIVGASCKRKDLIRQKQHDDFVKRIETDLWKPVREVLIALSKEGIDGKTRGIALGMAEKMEKFKFVFIAHLMVNLLRKTNDLSQALQLKNQNIGNAVQLIEDMKYDIKKYRDDG